MIRLILAIAAFASILGFTHAQTKPETKKEKVDPTEALFASDKPILTFKVNLNDENLKLLRKDPRTYVKCTITVGGETYTDVGVHIKGAAGSFRNWEDKPALTLNFDKFVKGQKIMGLDKIHLNNSVQDGSYLNEIICSTISREMDLPTARAGQGLVELNGRKVGLYVIKEGYNDKFVHRYFPNETVGNLYDGGFCADLNADLKLEAGEDNKRADLKAIVKACEIRDVNKRFEAVNKLVDADKFYTMAALDILGTSWDGYTRKANNYRIYCPKDGKAVIIPHGMDQMFQNPQEPLWQGWGSLVGRALLDHPDGKAKTYARLKEMVEKHFQMETWNKRIDEWTTRAKVGLVEIDKGAARNLENEVKGEKARLKQRFDYVTKELAKVK